MKIAIMSDFHLGFSVGKLTEDSFENAKTALEMARDCDVIIIAGDIFDSRSPKTSVWGKALKVLSIPLLWEGKGVSLVSCDKELKKISRRTLSKTPVLAVHGNHERRAKGQINAVEALENAGLLIHLHCNKIVLEKDGVRVAVHGMSSVPETLAKDVLEAWNPVPEEGCFNILVLHQNIDPYVYSPIEPPSLSLSSLPKGFDVIVDGHVHSTIQEKLGETTFLIPGSTIITQLEKKEAGSQKGFYKLYVERGEMKLEFIPIPSRRFFYEEVVVDNGMEKVEKKIDEILSQKFEKKPLIRIKIIGKETDVVERDLRELEKKYEDRAVLIFSKQLESTEIAEKIEMLNKLREERLSIQEIGMNVLESILKQLGFSYSMDVNTLFELMCEGEVDRAISLLTGEQKTLSFLLRKSLEGGK